jgi:fructosamine-3-kinase
VWLVLEYLNLGGSGDMGLFGGQLAQMHMHHSSQYGWHRDNTIGATHQPNDYQNSWIAFLQQQRFGYQLDLAKHNGCQSHLYESGQQLVEKISQFFEGYTPRPSLLHGDLWSGNYAFTRDSEAVIFDPAVYYGDREADMAMTELFGAFGQRFYQGYGSVLPLDSGYRVRKTLYNLYHIINHFNLFGGGYQSQAISMVEQLLSELR